MTIQGVVFNHTVCKYSMHAYVHVHYCKISYSITILTLIAAVSMIKLHTLLLLLYFTTDSHTTNEQLYHFLV